MSTFSPPRTSPSLKLADYGCALAHRKAWQRVADGPHEWVVVLEDDAELVDGVNLTDLPPVPPDMDLVMFRTGTIMRWAPVCDETEVMRAYWGFGMVGCVAPANCQSCSALHVNESAPRVSCSSLSFSPAAA